LFADRCTGNTKAHGSRTKAPELQDIREYFHCGQLVNIAFSIVNKWTTIMSEILLFSKRQYTGYRLANLPGPLIRTTSQKDDYKMKTLTGLAIAAFALTAVSATTPALADGHGNKLMKQIEIKVQNKAHAGVIAKRRMAMRAIVSDMKTIAGYLKANKGGPADVAKSAMAISNISKVVSELFPTGTGMARYPAVTGAKPAIFSDNVGFKKAAMTTASAAENLAKVASAPNAGKKEIGMAFGAVGKSCGSCHKVYRQKLKKKK
jgi:cytochrome c556